MDRDGPKMGMGPRLVYLRWCHSWEKAGLANHGENWGLAMEMSLMRSNRLLEGNNKLLIRTVRFGKWKPLREPRVWVGGF